MSINKPARRQSLTLFEQLELQRLRDKYPEFFEKLSLEILSQTYIKVPKIPKVQQKCFRCALEIKNRHCKNCIFSGIRLRLTKKCRKCEIHGHSSNDCLVINGKMIDLAEMTCFVCRSKGHVNCFQKGI
jgi:hypothetical protein